MFGEHLKPDPPAEVEPVSQTPPEPVQPARRGGLRLLYIGGAGRSGSTLLDLMVGQYPGVFSGGELRQIWQRGLRDNGYCGCRTRFRECPFWCQVGEAAFGGWQNLDLEALVATRRTLDRPSSFAANIPGRRSGGSGRARPGEIARYISALQSLLEGIRTVSGADVIADSSKSSTHARLLQRIPELDLRLVRLLRDSRAVVFSWQRGARESRSEIEARYQHLELGGEAASDLPFPLGPSRDRRPRGEPKLGVPGAALRWLASNVAAGRLASDGVPSIVVKYEELVSRPKQSLTSILQLAGLPVEAEDLSFVQGDSVAIRPNHTVFGSNRLRFFSGTLPLHLDNEWRRSMRRRDRVATAAMTFPLLLRHGYPLRSARATDVAPV